MPSPLKTLLITLTCAAALATGLHAQPLPEGVRAALQSAGLSEEQFGAVVLPLDAATPLVAHRAEVPMQPASTIKLITSAVALDRLGPNHRGRTELLSSATVLGDVLDGDLVLRGGVDPELGLPQLWALLAELRFQGIRVIRGDVILDRSLFVPARSDIGLPPFDEAPEFPYNVIPDALQLAGNLLSLELVSDAQHVSARVLPVLARVEVVNKLELVDAPCERWSRDAMWQTPLTTKARGVVTIELRGRFPKNCTQRPSLQLMDRTDLAERLLRHAWASLGGQWRGQAREGTAPAQAKLLAKRESRPWGEVLRVVNKESDNPLTRLLFLSLGLSAAKTEATTPTAELAAREVKRWFAERGIPSEGLVMDNGSGLSRSERITPMQMARVIQAALRGPYASELLMSMPLVGVDGQRFRGTVAAQRARLKPGGLRNVGALAGQVLDADGKAYVMVAFVNADTPVRGRLAVNELVEWIARSRLTLAAAAPTEPAPK
jgi:serine-type D-Ala-D-Ala carboxypeptidase/endopeptidase (penicillin-binding protein 4)